MAQKHTRILQHPFTTSLQGASLDSYAEEQCSGQLNIMLSIRAFEHTASPELFERSGIIFERVRGEYAPARLYFSRVSRVKINNFYTDLTRLSRHDPNRTINDMLAWRQPGRQAVFYLFFMQAPQIDSLMFFAHRVSYERLSDESIPVILERDWSPPPPMPARLIPQPTRLHGQFGGDPITIRINDKIRHRKLFIGGVEVQSNNRPEVDIVFNAGEEPSKWVKDNQTYPSDRWDNKGEGSEGMSVEALREEANWVIERLQNKQSILVHCAAGLNRSSTICCAVLIVLEGLSAEQALERVREHHPWARPDSHHWLALRWLEMTNRNNA
jgi:hypothetical protein